MGMDRRCRLKAPLEPAEPAKAGEDSRRRVWVRLLVVVIILPTAQVGFWAAFAPQSFVRDFPGWGLHWTATTDPVDEHFVRDIGLLHLALLAAALYTFARLVCGRMLGLTWTAFAVPHLWLHANHRTGLTDWENITSLSMLTISAGTGVVLILLAPPADDARGPGRLAPAKPKTRQ